MLISKTPLRVSFLGGGTDIASYFSHHEGLIISATINKFIYIAMKDWSEGSGFYLKYSKTERATTLSEIQHPIIRRVLEKYSIKDVEISILSDVPAGTGLGSSSAFSVGMINVARQYLGISSTPNQLAGEACEIEIEDLKNPIGIQDQYAAAYGGLNIFHIDKRGGITIEDLKMKSEFENLMLDNCILVRVPGTRMASNVLKKQNNNLINTDYLKKIHDLAWDFLAESTLNVERFGSLLNKSWLIKKSMNIENQEDNVLFVENELLKYNIYGLKLLGAGKAGFFLVVAPTRIIKEIKNSSTFETISPSLYSSGSMVLDI